MDNQIVKGKKLNLIILLVASIATLGSLYYSNYGDPVTNILNGVMFPAGGGFTPCRLCWWARILMYTIPLVSIVGLLKKEYQTTDYIIPQAFFGFFLESYHYYIQKFPNSSNATCSFNNPCNGMYVNYLDFITIPFLCWIAFTLILGIALYNSFFVQRKIVIQKN